MFDYIMVNNEKLLQCKKLNISIYKSFSHYAFHYNDLSFIRFALEKFKEIIGNESKTM
jgi:hypothetical protein